MQYEAREQNETSRTRMYGEFRFVKRNKVMRQAGKSPHYF
jgi:hypothetical protein